MLLAHDLQCTVGQVKQTPRQQMSAEWSTDFFGRRAVKLWQVLLCSVPYFGESQNHSVFGWVEQSERKRSMHLERKRL